MSAKANLLKYLELKGVKKASFYKSTGLSNGFLDKNDNISSDKIEIIISVYGDLNTTWLLTGEGEMLKSDAPENLEGKTVGAGDTYVAGVQKTESLIMKMLAEKKIYHAEIVDSMMAAKDELIANLRDEVKSLKDTIGRLRQDQ